MPSRSRPPSARSRRATRRAPARCCSSSWTVSSSRSRTTPPRSSASAPTAARSRSAPRPTRSRAPCSGRAGSLPSLRWAGSRRTTTCRTAWCRVRGCPRRCAGSRSSRRATGFASGTSSTRGTATCIRSSCTTPRRERRSVRASWPRRSSRSAWTPAARSRASTASAWTRPAPCRRCSPSATSASSSALRRAFDPGGISNPGKVIPTPRLCGEVPGPYRVHALERIGVAERL